MQAAARIIGLQLRILNASSERDIDTAFSILVQQGSSGTLVVGADPYIGLDASRFGTHSLRRIKASLIYRRAGNLHAVQLLLGHTKIESTVRYLGIEVDDALAIAEQVDV
jgi:integrase